MRRIKCCEAYWDSKRLENCPLCNKRLSPIGSGAMTCSADREAGKGQVSVEDEGAKRLIREDWRVPPVEAEAFAYVADYLESKARELQDVIDEEPWPLEDPEGVQLMEDLADEFREAAQTVRNATPKPESESSENAGDGKLPTDSIEAGNDSNNGTASGRRNSEL